jgi:predicted O-methyltransferase YrrM
VDVVMSYEDIDIPGWMSITELRYLHRIAAKMESIVEIGSWYGRSTHALVTACKGIVTAVDLWDQSLMVGLGDSMAARKAFFSKLGRIPNLNVLVMSSLEAAELFEDKSVDMVFIDGTHDYTPFLSDINVWLPKTKKLICGHDCTPAHTGVWKAVHEVFGKKFKLVDSIWSVSLQD